VAWKVVGCEIKRVGCAAAYVPTSESSGIELKKRINMNKWKLVPNSLQKSKAGIKPSPLLCWCIAQ